MVETDSLHSGGKRGIPVIGYRGRYDGPPIAETPARAGTAKDTRRWCKGVEGREHDAVWQFWFDVPKICGNLDYQHLKCTNCGRVMRIRTVPSDRPSHQGER